MRELADAASFENVAQENFTMLVGQTSAVVNINLLLLSEFSDIRKLKLNNSNTNPVLLEWEQFVNLSHSSNTYINNIRFLL